MLTILLLVFWRFISLFLNQLFTKMVSTRKKKIQQKNNLFTVNDFVLGYGSNVSVMENETLEQQINGHYDNSEKIVNSASQKKVKRSN